MDKNTNIENKGQLPETVNFELFSEQKSFIDMTLGKLDFVLDTLSNDDNASWGVDVAMEIVDNAKDKFEEFWEKAKQGDKTA